MGLNLEYDNAQTPIDEEEKEGLKIKSISNRKELDEFEQVNIQKAVKWSLGRKTTIDKILTEEFIKLLHKKMFDEVWKWAGSYRTSNKNIGVDKFEIGIELKNLLDDARVWHSDKVFTPDEFTIRLKHRLVKIHLFPNGNGRHSRLFADIIITQVFNSPVFSWGNKNLTTISDVRNKYISALKTADYGDYLELVKFSRS